MRCLVTGAYGFIGSHIVRALQAEGWDVIGAGRDLELGKRLLPDIEWVHCDFNRALNKTDWLERLEGVGAVINCVGILQSTLRDDADRIHREGTIALFQACAEAGVGRLIHISAMGAEAEISTDYAISKRAADEALKDLDFDWLVVKPSLVIGPGSYGGTSLIRGLSALPWITPLPGSGEQRFQPIAISDLALGLARLAKISVPSRTTLFAAGPNVLSIREIVSTYRTWLGFPKAREINVPLALMKPVLWLGDLAGWIGNPSALRSTSLEQMNYDQVVEHQSFEETAGLHLKSFSQTLAQMPATLQDRLHARLYFVKPLLQLTLALFWIFTGVIALLPGPFAAAVALVTESGVDYALAATLVWLGCVLDILLGVLFLQQRWVRFAGAAQIVLSLGYLFVLTCLKPELWIDPLGPLLKVVPLIAATAAVMALSEKR